MVSQLAGTVCGVAVEREATAEGDCLFGREWRALRDVINDEGHL